MTPQIEQGEINAIVWKACDTFRGTIDPSEYKNYILVMLFLKYISDVWQEHYDDLRTRYGSDEERIRRQLKYERFVLPEGADYYTLYDQRNESNLGERINIALEKIEDANKAKLDGVSATSTSTAKPRWDARNSATNGSNICWKTFTTPG